MSFYDFDAEIVAEQLTPPVLRQPKQLAWLKVLARPIQWLWQLIFEDYSTGVSYLDWANIFAYNAGDRIVWTDKSVYEAKVTHISISGSNEPTGNVDSADTWLKVQDKHTGADQRARYNSQIIVLEHILNKWYRIPTTDPQIYIENNVNTNGFLMGTVGVYSSKIPNNSVFMADYLWNTPDFSSTDFTVFVPVAFFATLGDTAQNRENNVRRIVDQYRIAGITYTVTTY